MKNDFWEKLDTSKEEDERLWELYHQNSKITKFDKTISREELDSKTLDLIMSHSYDEYRQTKLSADLSPFTVSLADAMKNRTTARNISPVEISLTDLSTFLFFAYGITRTNKDNNFPHPFRIVPSAGGLYPLEIYFHHNYVQGLDAGLYHYNPTKHQISHLLKGDQTRKIQELLIQPQIAIQSSLIIFITAFFERNSFKYGERGYRFANIEAGHVAQNIALTAQGLGLSTVTIGGYLDRKADDFLRLDGVTSSTLYITAIGKDKE
ncbi:MAG: SagB/ThcOx family dehydrogenase [Chitinophagaceae bacterium]|nr:SagB/ThcOx family dehydrogenase [Chitinophagaceae bacterium]